MIHDIDFVKPPKDRPILVQIVDELGICDHAWHEVYFDSTLDGEELEVYDEYGFYVGEICYWKELDK